MPRPAARSFKVKLVPDDRNLGWTVAFIRADLKKAWPGWKGRRVHGTINGFAFSNALFAGRQGQGYMLMVYKKILTGAHVRQGDTVTLTLEPDMDPPAVLPLPAELASQLKSDRALRKWFDALPPSTRKYICQWVAEAKAAETRQRRAEQMAERLYLTMDGEKELPPILRAAFELQPLARAGWQAMTAVQRRNHLLAIFYYRTVPGREKRTAQVVEEALAVARKRQYPG
ncbi:MAG TPA: YdeI/OmpD-associated family protein [Terracidiphilus sp.]